jgi:hypothetical protein
LNRGLIYKIILQMGYYYSYRLSQRGPVIQFEQKVQLRQGYCIHGKYACCVIYILRKGEQGILGRCTMHVQCALYSSCYVQ